MVSSIISINNNSEIALFLSNLDYQFMCVSNKIAYIPDFLKELPQEKIDFFVKFVKNHTNIEIDVSKNNIKNINFLVNEDKIINEINQLIKLNNNPDYITCKYIKYFIEQSESKPIDVNKLIQFTGGDKITMKELMSQLK